MATWRRRGKTESLKDYLEARNKAIESLKHVPATGMDTRQGPEGNSTRPFPDVETASGQVTTTITARSGTDFPYTLGQGVVELAQQVDDQVTSLGVSVVVYNGRMSEINAGKFVNIIRIHGRWWVFLADCGEY